MKMKNKNNLIPYDDVDGQKGIVGLEDTVRVEVSAPEQIKKPFKPDFKSNWKEVEKLKKEFGFDMYHLKNDLEKIHSISKPINDVELGYKSKSFDTRLRKLLKNIKE